MSAGREITRAVAANPDRNTDFSKGYLDLFEDSEKEVSNLVEQKTPQTVEVFSVKYHQYWAPFNYSNILLELGRRDKGAEYNNDGVEIDIPPYGAITIEEDEPIVGLEVIGSACAPPGYVMVNAEPLERKYPRTGVRMMVDNLWGEHVIARLWLRGVTEGWRECGLSSAQFSLPESGKITIMGGSQTVVGDREIEHSWHDGHDCVRLIRVALKST